MIRDIIIPIIMKKVIKIMMIGRETLAVISSITKIMTMILLMTQLMVTEKLGIYLAQKYDLLGIALISERFLLT